MNGLRITFSIPLFLVLYVAVALAFLHSGATRAASDWRTASREPVGLAPHPALVSEPVVQVYAARAMRWRGYFGVHPWIAVKPRNARQWTVYEVNGWRLRRTGSAVVESNRAPDGRWYGNVPELLADVRGEGVDALIERIRTAVEDYPWKQTYRVWPGPNSNTFVAHVLRAVPELRVDLPPTAVGKDYVGWRSVAKLPSGTGAQLSAIGVLGVAAGWEEGIELNVLGLTFGVDPKNLALKLPLVGSIGPKRFRSSGQVRSPLPATSQSPEVNEGE